jgi:16S rRNA (uracil1498-N3)-methyltransferase
MQLFYLENTKDEIILSTEESKHATKVLRKKEGDILNFTDGKGAFYKAEITVADSRKCRLKIVSSEQKEKQHNYHLHIAIAPTKNMDRFEWFLEKATEIGIDEITPIICRRSERKVIKTERCNRILLSAMKQSLKFHLPKLNEAISLNDFIKQDFEGTKYIAHCEEGNKTELKEKKKEKRTLILIGPEGEQKQQEL